MLVGHDPPAFGLLVVGVKFAAEIPEVLARVIEIYDLNGAGELFLADVPDPVGAVAHDHLDLRPPPAALMGFGVDPAGEGGGGFDGPRVGSGLFLAHGPPLVIGSGLGEDATEFGLAGVGSPVLCFAASALGFFGYHRQAGTVHLHIHLLDRLTHGDRQL